jgi:hypothetical protein
MLYRMNISKLLIPLSLFCKEKSIGPPNLSGRLFAGSLAFCATGRIDWALGLWGHRIKRTFGYFVSRRYLDFIVECVDDNFGFSPLCGTFG